MSASRLDQVAVLHLRYFLAVVDAGTVRAAAETIGISQPSLSQQIRTLERRLGRELFERHAAGMTPTPVARELETAARATIATLTALRTGGDGVENGEAVVGVPRGLDPALLDTIAGRVGPVSFTLVDSDVAPSAIRRGSVVAAVVRGPKSVAWRGLRAEVVHAGPLGVLLGAAHPLATRATLDWDDLRAQRLLWFDQTRAPRFAGWLRGLLRRGGWEPELVVLDPGGSGLVADALRRHDDLVALRPAPAPASSGLVWVPLTRPPMERFWLLQRDDHARATGRR